MKTFVVLLLLLGLFVTHVRQIEAAGYSPQVDQLQNQVQQLSVKVQQIIDMLNTLTNVTQSCCRTSNCP
jgi:hypothetical protein